MTDMNKTKKRKLEHLDVCANKDVETGTTWLEHCQFVPDTLTEVNPIDVDTSTMLLGKKLAAPLVISAITGGVEEAGKINKELAGVAEELGIGFGVGSQRAMIEDKSTWKTFHVRKEAPNTLVLGNIGAVNDYSPKQIFKAMEDIGADAMCMHLNVAQELAQPEGDKTFSHCLKNIENAVSGGVPVVAKETGAGISRESALKLKAAGVSAIDVGGSGGANWIKIENLRGKKAYTPIHWGIPTAASILECQVGTPLISTGGIRSGMDMAKCIALGADSAGVALPVLRWYYEGGKDLVAEELGHWITELRSIMVLTGSKDIQELKKANIVITGPLFDWCEVRGIDISQLGRRD